MQPYRESGLPQGHETKSTKNLAVTVTAATGKKLYITSIVNSHASTARTLTYKTPTTYTLDVAGSSSVSPAFPIVATEFTTPETDIAVIYVEA